MVHLPIYKASPRVAHRAIMQELEIARLEVPIHAQLLAHGESCVQTVTTAVFQLRARVVVFHNRAYCQQLILLAGESAAGLCNIDLSQVCSKRKISLLTAP